MKKSLLLSLSAAALMLPSIAEAGDRVLSPVGQWTLENVVNVGNCSVTNAFEDNARLGFTSQNNRLSHITVHALSIPFDAGERIEARISVLPSGSFEVEGEVLADGVVRLNVSNESAIAASLQRGMILNVNFGSSQIGFSLNGIGEVLKRLQTCRDSDWRSARAVFEFDEDMNEIAFDEDAGDAAAVASADSGLAINPFPLQPAAPTPQPAPVQPQEVAVERVESRPPALPQDEVLAHAQPQDKVQEQPAQVQAQVAVANVEQPQEQVKAQSQEQAQPAVQAQEQQQEQQQEQPQEKLGALAQAHAQSLVMAREQAEAEARARAQEQAMAEAKVQEERQARLDAEAKVRELEAIRAAAEAKIKQEAEVQAQAELQAEAEAEVLLQQEEPLASPESQQEQQTQQTQQIQVAAVDEDARPTLPAPETTIRRVHRPNARVSAPQSSAAVAVAPPNDLVSPPEFVPPSPQEEALNAANFMAMRTGQSQAFDQSMPDESQLNALAYEVSEDTSLAQLRRRADSGPVVIPRIPEVDLPTRVDLMQAASGLDGALYDTSDQPPRQVREVSNQELEEQMRSASLPQEVYSGATAISGSQESVAAPNTGNFKWSAHSGDDLRTTISRWSREEGVDLIWESDNQYNVLMTVQLNESYESALLSLLNQYRSNSPGSSKPVGEMFIDPESGSKALIIRSVQS
ncbi:MAG: TcpQ domain-containing protein [Alphaproteobacteria bacterium]